jgi:DNA methylase
MWIIGLLSVERAQLARRGLTSRNRQRDFDTLKVSPPAGPSGLPDTVAFVSEPAHTFDPAAAEAVAVASVAGYETDRGRILVCKIEEALDQGLLADCVGRTNLIFTSPPFPLSRPKRYGNKAGDEYIDWLAGLAPRLTELLAEDGSLVIEIGNAWEQGQPVMSTFPLKALLAFLESSGLFLCQQFICHNPARLPGPAQWANVERIRVKDSYTNVWWMGKTERAKANNRKVLTAYSTEMKRLLARKTYNTGPRPSGHVMREGTFLKDNGGAICECRKLGSTTVAGELPTCATVMQAAVMAEARRGHAWFKADPLGKLDDRLDQLLPVEERGVVVVGARDLHDTRLPGSRRRDRAALLGRHDRVAGAVHDRRRHLDARELVGERVAVTKQGPDGQEWIVDPPHRREVDERRAKHKSGWRVIGREFGHHRRAKALAVVEEARRGDLGLFDQEPVGRANIAGEPLLARSPRVATVAAVVEQQHRQTRARQCARQRRSQRPVAGVSISHQHRHATVRLAGLDQPRTQRQAVDGPQLHLPCVGDHRLRPWQLRREGKVDEAALEPDEHASINASVCRSREVASARTLIAVCEWDDLQENRVFGTHTSGR